MSQQGETGGGSLVQPRGRDRRGILAVVVTAAVGLGCAIEFVRLLDGHTTGGEIAGVIVAGSGVGVAAFSLAFMLSRRSSRSIGMALLVLWLALAYGGTVGYARHASPPTPSHASFSDHRPRPPLAPLTFTVFGLAGAAALVAAPTFLVPVRRQPPDAPGVDLQRPLKETQQW